MCRNPLKNVAFEFVLSSLAVPYMSCLFYLNGWWLHSCCLWGVASRICSRGCAAFLSSSHLAFFLWILLACLWCMYIVVWTKLRLGRNFVFCITDNLSTAFHAFARRILTFSRWDVAADVMRTGLLILKTCHLECRWPLFV